MKRRETRNIVYAWLMLLTFLPAMLLAYTHVHAQPQSEPSPDEACVQCLHSKVHSDHVDKDHTIKKMHCPLCHFSSEVYLASGTVSVKAPHVAAIVVSTRELPLPVVAVRLAMPRAPPACFIS